jgi:hypothetical protein
LDVFKIAIHFHRWVAVASQAMEGRHTNSLMKDVGKNAAATRAAKGIGREMARKAVATRLANKERQAQNA